jgi:uncharacterized membrane protein YgcG
LTHVISICTKLESLDIVGCRAYVVCKFYSVEQQHERCFRCSVSHPVTTHVRFTNVSFSARALLRLLQSIHVRRFGVPFIAPTTTSEQQSSSTSSSSSSSSSSSFGGGGGGLRLNCALIGARSFRLARGGRDRSNDRMMR